LLTSRIIIQEDIQKTLNDISNDATLSDDKKLNYQSLILFLSYSGQRTVTASRLTAKQFSEALNQNPPVLTVEAGQDKIRLQHYVPLHPLLLPYIKKVIIGKGDNDTVFDYLGLQRWLKHHTIAMSHTKGKLELKDLRKFFEQKSDEIGFTDANKNFIMSHGVSSINWTSYKQFLPENVYKRYMECWSGIIFI
jgi:integrase